MPQAQIQIRTYFTLENEDVVIASAKICEGKKNYNKKMIVILINCYVNKLFTQHI